MLKANVTQLTYDSLYFLIVPIELKLLLNTSKVSDYHCIWISINSMGNQLKPMRYGFFSFRSVESKQVQTTLPHPTSIFLC